MFSGHHIPSGFACNRLANRAGGTFHRKHQPPPPRACANQQPDVEIIAADLRRGQAGSGAQKPSVSRKRGGQQAFPAGYRARSSVRSPFLRHRAFLPVIRRFPESLSTQSPVSAIIRRGKIGGSIAIILLNPTVFLDRRVKCLRILRRSAANLPAANRLLRNGAATSHFRPPRLLLQRIDSL